MFISKLIPRALPKNHQSINNLLLKNSFQMRPFGVKTLKDAKGIGPNIKVEFDKEDAPLEERFDFFMRITQKEDQGRIPMTKIDFYNQFKYVKTEQDMAYVIEMMTNMIGHRVNFISSDVDQILQFALDKGYPETMHPLISHHEYLMTHPHQSILKKYIDHYNEQGIEKAKMLFEEAIQGRFLLQLPEHYHRNLLEFAIESDEKELALNVYLDILDYDNAGLEQKHYFMVLENCFKYGEEIDNVLFEQLKGQLEKLELKDHSDLKLYNAVYFYQLKAYFSASDELALIKDKVSNSNLTKEFMFDKIFEEDSKCDQNARQKFVEELQKVQDHLDLEFYDIESHIKTQEEEVVEEEINNGADASEHQQPQEDAEQAQQQE